MWWNYITIIQNLTFVLYKKAVLTAGTKYNFQNHPVIPSLMHLHFLMCSVYQYLIPIGMYLTDLTYINTIHPATGGLDTVRNNKMNEILRIISDFQFSQYEIDIQPHIRHYLLSVKYIEELQNFMEDENYKVFS